MLETKLGSHWIKDYLRATRGNRYGYTPYPCDMLNIFFSTCLEYLASRGLEVDAIRMVTIYSSFAEVETVHKSDSECYLVYDQSFKEVLHLLNGEYVRAFHSADNGETPDYTEVPWWIRAIHANRFLTVGNENRALFNALLCRGAPSQPVEYSEDDIKMLIPWELAQEAFIIAHEIGHCKVGGQVLARGLSESFDELVREYVKLYDASHAAPNQASDPERMYERLRRYGIEATPEMAEEYSSELSAFLSSTAASKQEQLDWIVKTDSEIGEEILSDFLAIYFVTGILGDRVLPFDECLKACILASMHIQLWRVCQIWGTTSDRTVMLRLMQEGMMRRYFLGAIAMVLSRRDDLDKLYRKNLTDDDFVKAQLERSADLVAIIEKMADVYVEWIHERMLRASVEWYMNEEIVAEDKEFLEFATSADLPDIIVDSIRIGANRFSWAALDSDSREWLEVAARGLSGR